MSEVWVMTKREREIYFNGYVMGISAMINPRGAAAIAQEMHARWEIPDQPDSKIFPECAAELRASGIVPDKAEAMKR